MNFLEKCRKSVSVRFSFFAKISEKMSSSIQIHSSIHFPLERRPYITNRFFIFRLFENLKIAFAQTDAVEDLWPVKVRHRSWHVACHLFFVWRLGLHANCYRIGVQALVGWRRLYSSTILTPFCTICIIPVVVKFFKICLFQSFSNPLIYI